MSQIATLPEIAALIGGNAPVAIGGGSIHGRYAELMAANAERLAA